MKYKLNLKRKKGYVKFSLSIIMFSLLTTSCYTPKWSTGDSEYTAPVEISELFYTHNNTIKMYGKSPSSTYKYDTAEKDLVYAEDSISLHFNKVSMSLKDNMPRGKVLVDMVFEDEIGNKVLFNDFDLMRIIPTYNTTGDNLYPELLLEEFNRYGVNFRREFKEFSILKSEVNNADYNAAIDRTYRASIVNGCLDPGKWEMVLTSEDYSDFDSRVKNPVNFNQNKLLAHSWFVFPKDLYRKLVAYKNPGVKIAGFDVADFDYEKLSNHSEDIVIDFSDLRGPIKRKWNVEVLEVGHKSNRPIALLDLEEHYKIEYGLFIGYDERKIEKETYRSILEPQKQPLKFAQFRDEGFYSPRTAVKFDVNWLSHLDEVTIESVAVQDTECLLEIKITGKWSPYTITIGNFDLSAAQEQKLYGLHFGFNVYSKGRRYNPAQATLTYDEDLMPKEYQRYLLMTDTKTGKWVDNFHKGLGKVYVTFDSLEKDVLNVYLVSYERIAPLWMAKVKLPKELREKARIRKQLYSY